MNTTILTRTTVTPEASDGPTSWTYAVTLYDQSRAVVDMERSNPAADWAAMHAARDAAYEAVLSAAPPSWVAFADKLLILSQPMDDVFSPDDAIGWANAADSTRYLRAYAFRALFEDVLARIDGEASTEALLSQLITASWVIVGNFDLDPEDAFSPAKAEHVRWAEERRDYEARAMTALYNDAQALADALPTPGQRPTHHMGNADAFDAAYQAYVESTAVGAALGEALDEAEFAAWTAEPVGEPLGYSKPGIYGPVFNTAEEIKESDRSFDEKATMLALFTEWVPRRDRALAAYDVAGKQAAAQAAWAAQEAARDALLATPARSVHQMAQKFRVAMVEIISGFGEEALDSGDWISRTLTQADANPTQRVAALLYQDMLRVAGEDGPALRATAFNATRFLDGFQADFANSRWTITGYGGLTYSSARTEPPPASHPAKASWDALEEWQQREVRNLARSRERVADAASDLRANYLKEDGSYYPTAEGAREAILVRFSGHRRQITTEEVDEAFRQVAAHPRPIRAEDLDQLLRTRARDWLKGYVAKIRAEGTDPRAAIKSLKVDEVRDDWSPSDRPDQRLCDAAMIMMVVMSEEQAAEERIREGCYANREEALAAQASKGAL